MRAVLNLIVLLIATLLLAALLSYPVYQLLAEQQPPFHKVLSRLLVFSGLILSFCFLALNKILNKNALGYTRGKRSKTKTLALGLITGAFIVLILETALLLLGIHGIDSDFDNSLKAISTLLLKAVISGLLVAFIEETIFRGAIFSALLRDLNALMAVIVSSFFYAAVHFIKIPALANEGISWLSGFKLLPHAMDSLFNPQMFDLFLTLFVLGMFLSLLRLREKNIYLCVGVHAGIVMLVKVVNYLTDYTPGSAYDFLVNYVNHQMGYLASFWLSAIFLLTLFKYKPLPSRQCR